MNRTAAKQRIADLEQRLAARDEQFETLYAEVTRIQQRLTDLLSTARYGPYEGHDTLQELLDPFGEREQS